MLKNPNVRLNVLDRALLRNFWFDDLKQVEEKLYNRIKEEDPLFSVEKYKKAKEELKFIIEKIKSRQMRLHIAKKRLANNSSQSSQSAQEFTGNPFTEESNFKKLQQMKLNYNKECSAIDMTNKFLLEDVSYKKQKNIQIIDYLMHFDPELGTPLFHTHTSTHFPPLHLVLVIRALTRDEWREGPPLSTTTKLSDLPFAEAVCPC